MSPAAEERQLEQHPFPEGTGGGEGHRAGRPTPQAPRGRAAWGALVLFGLLVLAGLAQWAASPKAPPSGRDAQALEAQARKALAGLPVRFEANRGQSDPRVKFLARGPGFGFFLTGAER